MAREAAIDAVIVGGGHNGLVAANILADAGWRTLVVEAADRLGGAVHSDESLRTGFVTDWFSSFYPLAAASPVLRRLDLPRWGLRWTHAPAVLAHVFPDDRCAVLSRDLDVTAASLDAFAPGDGAAWVELVRRFELIKEPLLDAVLGPFPPLRAAGRLARTLGVADLLRFARFAVQPVRRFGEETFDGEGGPMLFAGNALHTDLAPEAAGSAIYGWLLSMLAQTDGFPVPVGGSGAIVDALVARLKAAGGAVRLNAEVASIDVADHRTTGVTLASGERIEATSVLADVGAPALYQDLVGASHLPERLLRDLKAFQWDAATLKVNWALSGPIPWTAAGARGAGTVHLGTDLDGLTRYATSLTTGQLPAKPFLLLGQMTTADATRSPAGTESAWAYTHVPDGLTLTAAASARQVARIEAAVERHAPGFGELVLARAVQTPADLHAADLNLFAGAVGGGTAAIHQELFFRPVPGLGRAETPIDGLYLASASAHPGGGVHGAPGSNAALAALRRHGRTGRLHRAAIDAAYRRIYR
ncbi:NAD(P)/FAD-dependent oxidoreductase [Jatrophihabitans sp.]|uniref:phytoene desaturase family protein n=1 Tax=Jatrophihabitans sp. TaxID=1932789 RepID=UPI0030C73CC6|nr:dependent oxidoreductase [Jatrophihabitans sp.]